MNGLQWTSSNEFERAKAPNEDRGRVWNSNFTAELGGTLTKTLLVIARIRDGIRRFQMNTISEIQTNSGDFNTKFVLRNSSCW